MSITKRRGDTRAATGVPDSGEAFIGFPQCQQKAYLASTNELQRLQTSPCNSFSAPAACGGAGSSGATVSISLGRILPRAFAGFAGAAGLGDAVVSTSPNCVLLRAGDAVRGGSCSGAGVSIFPGLSFSRTLFGLSSMTSSRPGDRNFQPSPFHSTNAGSLIWTSPSLSSELWW